MTLLSHDNEIEFYKFLNGNTTVSELENFIYEHLDLEQQLDRETYLELIALDFKDKYVVATLPDFIKKQVIKEGQFETWKLESVLSDFLTDVKNLHIHLDKLYHLYCGTYQDNEQRKYEFKFLGNLGLNYLWWVDESYMKANYGDSWKQEYEKSFNDFTFYHQQLKPFALEILFALDKKQIVILDDGTYKISDDLKSKLETDKTYQLKHPDKKYSS
jgi:hypothetical protein